MLGFLETAQEGMILNLIAARSPHV